MKDRYLPYGAITLLSFSLCLLGFLITPNSPHLGALMGLLVGGSLGILLLQVTRFDTKSGLDQQQSYNRRDEGKSTPQLTSLSEHVRQLEQQHQHEIDELKEQLNAVQRQKNQFRDEIRRVNQQLDIVFKKINKSGTQVTVETPDISLQNVSSNQSSPQIIQWLGSHQVELITSYTGHNADTILDQTAFFMGANYPLLCDVLHKIRQSLSCNHFGFQVNLTDEGEQKITAVTNLGTKLKSIGFLSYKYQRHSGQKIAHIRTLDSNGTQFLTGEWLERYVYQVITGIFEEKDLDYEALMNAVIKRDDGSQAEIDLLCFVKEKPLWIECKVANCEESIARYSRFARLFNLTPQQMFLIVLDLPPNQAQTLTDIHHVQVLTPDEVPDAIENTLQVFDGGEPLPRAISSVVAPASNSVTNQSEIPYKLTTQRQLQSFFIATGLRPLPEDRQTLIKKLIERVSSQAKPETMPKIKMGLYADLNQEVSKSKISEFLRTCLKSGCFLNQDNQIIREFQTPVSHLISQNYQDLENKCVEGIAFRVLTQDANYFKSADRCSHFQALVGAAPPDASRLAALEEEINGSA
ncbi:Card1-like endonuclease domain-containing protein [Sodalinema gerasimenkoae]|uniref:Card1-like endonuclease domain-containing protein n=1 Tax=Sodalinema gerasimenkoae TaxID=2862348 RepID=UPI00135CC9ED|nr:DUF1887 family CARF protein [Sodalinema gerasimenkoae]